MKYGDKMTQDSLVTGSGVADYAPREQPGDYRAQGLTDAPFICQPIRVVPGVFAEIPAPAIEAKWVYERIGSLESALTSAHWQITRLQEDIDFLEGALGGQTERAEEAESEASRLRNACMVDNDTICQTLGQVLGFPWFKDDQENFPGATEASGVCVGHYVAEDLARMAADRITRRLAPWIDDEPHQCGPGFAAVWKDGRFS